MIREQTQFEQMTAQQRDRVIEAVNEAAAAAQGEAACLLLTALNYLSRPQVT